jgi:hypothetical protein
LLFPNKITVVIDEFQDFLQINPIVYSDLQKLWDLNKSSVKLHIIFIGSIYSLMHKIFEENKQPLFGRADRIFNIKPFSIKTLAIILKDHKIFTKENLFNFYVVTGNMPKYLDYILQYKTNPPNNLENLLNIILQKDSIFINEGKNLLIEEFGRDYLTYFTILELISRGKTARSEIEFLLSNYTTYAGRILEYFFKQLLAETGKFNTIGSYWEKNNNNEIDIVAINDLEKIILIAETKLNKSKINVKNLEIKAQKLLLDYPGYKSRFLSLSIEDCDNNCF